MPKSVRKLASIVCLATAIAGVPLFLTGCENPQKQADVAAAEKIAKAEADRAVAEKDKSLADNPKLLDAVQGQYDTLGTDSTISPEMKTIVKGRQAQVRYERVLYMLTTLREKELDIARHITAIDQIASQIEGSQKYVKALASYDPTAANAALKARQLEIDTGDQWKQSAHTAAEPNGELTFPTVAKLQAMIDDLNGKITKAKSDIDALRKKSADLVDQAETLTRKAETETGDALVADETNASNARKEAALADAQAESINSDLTHMQADLDSAQAQKVAVMGASQTFTKETETALVAWESVQNQITAEKKMQQMLIAGGWATEADKPKAQPSSIVAEATELAKDLKDAAALRKTVVDELGKCVAQFKGAAGDAQAVRTALITKIKDQAHLGDADLPIWKQQMETLHPGNFTLSQAAAQTTLATVAANDAAITYLLEQMFDGYSVGPELVAAPLKEFNISMEAPTKPTEIAGLTALLTSDSTGIEMPKELGDVTKPTKADVAKAIDEADKQFTAAIAVYDQPAAAADSGQAAADRIQSTLQGKAIAQRLWGNFDLMVGLTDKAEPRLKAADTMDAQLPAAPKLPADVVPAAPVAPVAPAPVTPPVAPATVPPAAAAPVTPPAAPTTDTPAPAAAPVTPPAAPTTGTPAPAPAPATEPAPAPAAQ